MEACLKVTLMHINEMQWRLKCVQFAVVRRLKAFWGFLHLLSSTYAHTLTHVYMHKEPAGSYTFNNEQTQCEWVKVGSSLASKGTELQIYAPLFLIPAVSSKSSDVFDVRVYISLVYVRRMKWFSVPLWCLPWNICNILGFFLDIYCFSSLCVCIVTCCSVCTACECCTDILRWQSNSYANLVVITFWVPGNATDFFPTMGPHHLFGSPTIESFIKSLVETQNHQICVGHIIKHYRGVWWECYCRILESTRDALFVMIL